MKFSLEWARQYVDLPDSVQEIADRLTLIGYMVESIDAVHPLWRQPLPATVAEVRPSAFRKVVTLRLAPHGWDNHFLEALMPEGPRPGDTIVCELRVGEVVQTRPLRGEAHEVRFSIGQGEVTTLLPHGAPAVGSKHALLCLGTGSGIAKLATEADIGYSSNSHEPVPLPGYYRTGALLADEFRDTVLELEVRQNRPDCLGIYGICRDLAGAFDVPLRPLPPAEPPNATLNIHDHASLRIDAPDLCNRFAIQVIRGVRIGPSPRWLADRLTSCGVRSINNVVDVTNYVMLETGQPLHAFDYDRMDNHDIVIRRAHDGEVIHTLDEREYALRSDMLLVANRSEPLALAGIVGGKSSEVTENTTNLLLDAANYNYACIRRASRRLGVRTEASTRLEKFLDIEGVPYALQRATAMIVELAGGQCASSFLDAYPNPRPPTRIDVRPESIARLIGQPFTADEISACLRRIQIPAEPGDGVIRVTVPTWRTDITQEADVAEEVARIFGYENIPTARLDGEVPHRTFENLWPIDEVCRDVLAGFGLDEVITDTLVNPDTYERLYRAAGAEPPALVHLVNPISSELRALRPSLLLNLADSVMINHRAGREHLAFFEIGRVFERPAPHEYREWPVIAGIQAGTALPRSWYTPAQPYDVFHAKGVVEALAAALGIRSLRFEPAEHPLLHPGRTGRVHAGETRLGLLGELHPRVRDFLDMKHFTAVFFELDLDALARLHAPHERYANEFPFEPVLLDLSVLVDRSIPAQALHEAIHEAGQPLLRTARLIDLYEGERIPPGKKSLTFALRFQVPDRTLTMEEVTPIMARIEEALADRFAATKRG